MSVNLVFKPVSVPEFLGGLGIALAAVALIVFGVLRDAQPQNAMPAPAGYASVSIQSSEALATISVEQPRLSVEQRRALFAAAAAASNVQSSDTRLGTGNATPIESNAQARRPLAADLSAAPTAGQPVGLRIQQHGIDSDAPTVFPDARLANSQRRTVP